jgi:CheY-like chemotaxis protein
MLIQKLLNPKVKSLQIAGDGISALGLAKKVKFDIILMDLNLPKMSGMDVVAEIRKNGSNITTPIAVITSNVWEEQLDLIRQNGIDTIIQKPFNRKDLYFQIYTLCNEKKGDLIELNYLKQMSGGDHYFIVEVLATYQNNILTDMVKLTDAVHDGDKELSKNLAHKMKSSFRMLEIQEACEICEEIEIKQGVSNSINLVKILKIIIDKSLIETQDLILKYSN